MQVQINFNEWYKGALDAVEHLDALPGHYLLRSFEKALLNVPPEYQNSVRLKDDLKILKKKLSFVAFPDLPIDQAQEILQKNLLDFLKSDIDLNNRLFVRYSFVGYGGQEKDRQMLKSAILSNQERLGDTTIGDWLKDFDVKTKPEDRNAQDIITFITQSPKAAPLDKSNQNILKRLLKVYDEWLATELLNIFDIAVLNKQLSQSPGKKNSLQNGRLSQGAINNKTVNQELIQLPLLQALSKLENLGNQLITNERIRVKSQLEPVRPSLLYWLKYYRDELGIGQHNSVERGDFLFRSENGRKLSPEERERISLILKSLEENLPLSIDTERQEIIFPVFQGVQVSSHQSEPLQTATPLVRRVNNDFGSEKNIASSVATPKNPTFQNLTFFSPVQGDSNDLSKKERTDQIKSSEFVGRNAPVLNSYANNALGGGGMSFSTGHIFPAEKEVIVKKSFRPAPTKKAFDDSNPFIINPSRGGDEIDN